MSRRTAWMLLVVSLVLGRASCGGAPPERLDGGRLGTVFLYRPSDRPAGLVVLFSDAKGWNDDAEGAAAALRDADAAVLGVDLAEYQKRLRASDDGCHYVVGEIE